MRCDSGQDVSGSGLERAKARPVLAAPKGDRQLHCWGQLESVLPVTLTWISLGSLLTLTPTTHMCPSVCLDVCMLMLIKSQRPYILHSIIQILYKTTVPFLLVRSEHWLDFCLNCILSFWERTLPYPLGY